MNDSKFIVFLEGGGWCFNETECHDRAFKRPGVSSGWLGSSTHAPLSLDPHGEGGHGILSGNATLNPDFYDWNVASDDSPHPLRFFFLSPVLSGSVASHLIHADVRHSDDSQVMLNYCDGGSFAGNRDEPLIVHGAPIYFRGHGIFHAVISDLKERRELSAATDAILGGCSAGGMAVYLHCDEFSALVPSTAKTRCIADAGFFPDVESVHGEEVARTQFSTAFGIMNSSAGVDQSCIAAQPNSSLHWRCYFPEHTLPYITTPLFVLNSAYDPVSNAWEFGEKGCTFGCSIDVEWAPCLANFSTCTMQQLSVVQEFRAKRMQRLAPAFDSSSPHGSFIDSCSQHCQGSSWTAGARINGNPGGTNMLSMRDAVSRWLQNIPTKLKDVPWKQGMPTQCPAAALDTPSCGEGGISCVCTDTWPGDERSKVLPLVEICVDPVISISAANIYITVLNKGRQRALLPAPPNSCTAIGTTNVTASPGNATVSGSIISVYRQLECSQFYGDAGLGVATGSRGENYQQLQLIQFEVMSGATAASCKITMHRNNTNTLVVHGLHGQRTSAPKQDRFAHPLCTPLVSGCCVQLVRA